MSGEFELFDCDMYPEDDEPEHICTCSADHDDLEHAENLCSACGLLIYDPWGICVPDSHQHESNSHQSAADSRQPTTPQPTDSGKGER
jgi:hypothetical protein